MFRLAALHPPSLAPFHLAGHLNPLTRDWEFVTASFRSEVLNFNSLSRGNGVFTDVVAGRCLSHFEM